MKGTFGVVSLLVATTGCGQSRGEAATFVPHPDVVIAGGTWSTTKVNESPRLQSGSPVDKSDTDRDPVPYVAADDPAEAARLLRAQGTGRSTAGSIKFGPCVLYPSPIRIRTSGRVGTKPHTKCEKYVTSIHHSTDLRYKSFIWWKLKGTKKATGSRTRSLLQKNVEFSCDSSEKTQWASTTLGTIVYNGRTYYARVYPARESLPCGG